MKLLAYATVADYADRRTVDHSGRVVPYTRQKLNGRLLVLRRLAERYGGKRAVEEAARAAREMDRYKSREKRVEIARQLARRLGIPPATARSILHRVSRGRRRR